MTAKIKKIKILHFASFTGNIGDNLNHSGLYKSLDKELGKKNYTIHKEEIREYFWKNKNFDSKIISRFNEFDLVIIGGGNFFELWVENSRTGTSIDIPIEFLKKIKPHIIFFSLGVDIHQGYSKNTKSNFFKFFDYITNQDKYFVSVRNDGAFENLRKLYGNFLNQKICVIPDSGIKLTHSDLNKFETNENLIGINLAGDMIDRRFYNLEKSISEIISFINYLILEKNKNIVFLPHITKDYEIIFSIMDGLSDENKRKYISIAPYQNGEIGMKNIFGIYSNCEIILANRFHSNLASIGLGKPTIGLFNYPQIKNLYSELKLDNYLVDLNNKNFLKNLKGIYNELTINMNFHTNHFLETSLNISNEHNDKMHKLCNWIKLKI